MDVTCHRRTYDSPLNRPESARHQNDLKTQLWLVNDSRDFMLNVFALYFSCASKKSEDILRNTKIVGDTIPYFVNIRHFLIIFLIIIPWRKGYYWAVNYTGTQSSLISDHVILIVGSTFLILLLKFDCQNVSTNDFNLCTEEAILFIHIGDGYKLIFSCLIP